MAGYALVVAGAWSADGEVESELRLVSIAAKDAVWHEEGKAKKKRKKAKKEPKGLWEWIGEGDWPVLYKDKDGFIEQWDLLGRFDLQYGHLDSDRGDVERFEVRRLRIGTSVEFLDDWRLKVVANMTDGSHVRYGGLNSAYVRYRPSKNLKFKLGKQTARFGQEWSTPSMDLGVIERSLLVNQVRPRRAVGVTMEGDWKDWSFELGAFSGDVDRGFGDFDAGMFYLASIGYDLTEIFDWWKDFDWRIDYLYNDGHRRNTAAKRYSHSLSTSVYLRKKRFRMAAEAIYVDGMQGRPDAWGFLVTPSWEVIDNKLDAVLRYHYARAEGRDGLRLQTRYDGLAPNLSDRGRGEEFHSLYLGLNYHLAKDRATLMTGVQWSHMHDHFGDGGDFSGFTFLTALRFGF